MLMTPYDYQIDLAKQAYAILKEYGIVYLAMEERTGKSITSLLAIEESNLVKDVLIITKKKALSGWEETLKSCKWLTKKYDLVNYHSAKKIKGSYDIVVLDESHAYLSACPRTSNVWKDVSKLCSNKPIIYISATPYAQGIQLLYNQFSLSAYSPWRKYRNFYKWYSDYAELDHNGDVDTIWISGRKIKTYKKVDHKKALSDVDHLFITKTRKSLNFKQEPTDVMHYVELSESTKKAYNILVKNRVLNFEVSGKEYKLIADTSMKLRVSLHMLEGGVMKVKGEDVCLSSQEKIDYIIKNWGDTKNNAIMYLYIAEGNKLRSKLKNTQLFQSISHAEGIDLSDIDNLIIYSQDFSTAKHTQRRARQANTNRTKPINVHFLLVKDAISDQVYKAVSINKVNYVDSLFKKQTLK